MASREISKQLQRMRRDWDQRARENAHYYVATGKEQWTEEDFYRSGKTTVEQYIMADIANITQGKNPKDMKVLEIGCGAGRITRAMAGVFGQVYAVDISPEMVRRARKALRQFPNAHIFRNNGKDLSGVRTNWWSRFGLGESLVLDFAFSYIVFQHIPSRAIIENYVREVNRLLRPGGLFKFQVQGNSQVLVKAEESWVGVPFTEREAREMAQRCGFEMRYEHGVGEQDYWLWFFKTRDAGSSPA